MASKRVGRRTPKITNPGLKAAVKKAGGTFADLAIALNITRATPSKWTAVPPAYWIRLNEIYGIPIATLRRK